MRNDDLISLFAQCSVQTVFTEHFEFFFQGIRRTINIRKNYQDWKTARTIKILWLTFLVVSDVTAMNIIDRIDFEIES